MKVYELFVSAWKLSENKENLSKVSYGSVDLYRRKKSCKKAIMDLAPSAVEVGKNFYETQFDENGIQLIYEIVKRHIIET